MSFATTSRRLLSSIVLCAGVAACASGPKLSEMGSKLPPIPPGDGRMFVYRATAFGAAIQPAVKINGVSIGDAVPHGFLFADRPAGSYTISTTTEVERDLGLALAAGQTRYVRLGISFGFFAGHVYPELVDNDVGEKEIADLHFAGQ